MFEALGFMFLMFLGVIVLLVIFDQITVTKHNPNTGKDTLYKFSDIFKKKETR